MNYTVLEENKVIFNVVLEMVNRTAQELTVKYKVFEECCVLPVGSFMENTKIGSADEFDFSVILPYFKNFDRLDSPYNKDYEVLLKDLNFIPLTSQLITVLEH